MQRYFFDVVAGKEAEHDFKGRELRSAEAALRIAELIALDEAVDGQRLGWTVRVSDAIGNRLFMVPIVPNAELMAA